MWPLINRLIVKGFQIVLIT